MAQVVHADLICGYMRRVGDLIYTEPVCMAHEGILHAGGQPGTAHIRDTLELSDWRGGEARMAGRGCEEEISHGEEEISHGERAESAALTRRNQSAPNVLATRWHMEASSPAC